MALTCAHISIFRMNGGVGTSLPDSPPSHHEDDDDDDDLLLDVDSPPLDLTRLNDSNASRGLEGRSSPEPSPGLSSSNSTHSESGSPPPASTAPSQITPVRPLPPKPGL